MIPKQDLLVCTKKVYNKIKELIDDYRNNIETNDNFYYTYLLEELKRINFWNIYCSSNKICMHIYKNGKKEGQICGAKVFIETDNKLQKFLCSRHCRNYATKSRNYTKDNKRCSFIRSNGNMCKHKCGKGKNYCYIHKEEEEDKHIESLEIVEGNLNDFNMNRDLFLKKLEKRRKLYFIRKKNKLKYINNNVIININKNMKISKIPNFSKFFKLFNLYNNYKYYKKIKYK